MYLSKNLQIERVDMENNYTKAYKEVIEVLKYVPDESVNKIPKEMIEMFNEKMDKSYNFSIDITRNFEEQELLEETKAIFANIYRDYWATPEEKEEILKKEAIEWQKIEEEKRLKYNSNIFEKKEHIKMKENSIIKDKNNEVQIQVKKETFFQKIIKFFQKIFKVN